MLSSLEYIIIAQVTFCCALKTSSLLCKMVNCMRVEVVRTDLVKFVGIFTLMPREV